MTKPGYWQSILLPECPTYFVERPTIARKRGRVWLIGRRAINVGTAAMGTFTEACRVTPEGG